MEQKKSWPNLILKVIMAFVGVMFCAIGTTFLRAGNVGVDPYTAMNMGLAQHLGIGLGNITLISNILFFILIFFLNKKQFGIGTFINMILLGYEVQWFTALYHEWFGSSSSLLVIVANTMIGLLVLSLGASLYMAPEIGVAPYDAFAPIFSAKLHKPYQVIRVMQDVFFMIAAVLVGGPVGFATFIVAFFMGPLITWWDTHVSDPMVADIDEVTQSPEEKKSAAMAMVLKDLAKGGYHSLINAIQSTTSVRKDVKDYSLSELKERQKIISRDLRHTDRMRNILAKREALISQEISKRTSQTQK